VLRDSHGRKKIGMMVIASEEKSENMRCKIANYANILMARKVRKEKINKCNWEENCIENHVIFNYIENDPFIFHFGRH
jgi:hypothetical protein